MPTNCDCQIKYRIIALLLVFMLNSLAGNATQTISTAEASTGSDQARGQEKRSVGNNFSESTPENQNKKRFLEVKLGEWRMNPGLAPKFGRGYNFLIGPKLSFRKNFDSTRKLTISTQYLPLSFRDIPTDSKINLFSVSTTFQHNFQPRFFYQVGLGLNSFRTTRGIREFVNGQGGKIEDKNLLNGSFSLAYQLFKVPYSYKSQKRNVLFYLKLTWREGDKYEFGTNFGAAGSEYKNSRQGLSIRLYPMLRKF